MTRQARAATGRAGARDRPALGLNFLVDFGDGQAREAGGGFSEVVFPELRIPSPTGTPPQAMGSTQPEAVAPANTLILRRGVRGALDLYAWWDLARKGQAPHGKSLKVQLLAEDHKRVVLTWTFHEVRPVALSYTPLRALASEVVIETLEVAFDGFELS